MNSVTIELCVVNAAVCCSVIHIQLIIKLKEIKQDLTIVTLKTILNKKEYAGRV